MKHNFQKIFIYLQCHSFNKRAEVARHCKVWAFFIALNYSEKYSGVVPPSKSRNSSLALLLVDDNGKGGTVFLLPKNKCHPLMKNSNQSGSSPDKPRIIINIIQGNNNNLNTLSPDAVNSVNTDMLYIEIEHLKQQIINLQEINNLLKLKNT